MVYTLVKQCMHLFVSVVNCNGFTLFILNVLKERILRVEFVVYSTIVSDSVWLFCKENYLKCHPIWRHITATFMSESICLLKLYKSMSYCSNISYKICIFFRHQSIAKNIYFW